MKSYKSPQNFAKRFAKDEQGGVLIIFGLAIVFLAAIGGAAVDLGQQQLMRLKLQNSVDLAVTSAGSLISCRQLITSVERGQAVQRYFKLNYPEHFADRTERPTLNVTENTDKQIKANTNDKVKTFFVSNFAIPSLSATASSGASVLDRNLATNFDAVLVVDESGSMIGEAKADATYIPPDFSGNTPPKPILPFAQTRAAAARNAFTTFVTHVFPNCIVVNPNVRMGFVGFTGFISNKWGMTSIRADAMKMPQNIYAKGRNIEELGIRAGTNMLLEKPGGINEIATWNYAGYQPGWYAYPQSSVVRERTPHPEDHGYDPNYVLAPGNGSANERRGLTHPISTNIPGNKWYPLAGNQGYTEEGFDDLSVDFDTRVPLPSTQRKKDPDHRYMIFMSDGLVATDSSTGGTTQAMIDECNAAKAVSPEVTIFTINFTSKGPNDEAALKSCASTNPSTGQPYYFFAPDEAALKTILQNIGSTILKTRIVQ